MTETKATIRLRRILLLTAAPVFGLLAAPASAQTATGDPGAILLETVVVEADEAANANTGSDAGSQTGAAAPPTGTIGTAPAPYAGGLVATGVRLGALGNKPFIDTPFSVSSFTNELIRDQQAQTLGEVVLNDASVRNDASAFSERDSFLIRGFSVTNLDTAFDGLFYVSNPRRSYLEGIEQVEIFKGPTALLSGGVGRVGGTINLVPKRAGDEPLTRLTTTYTSESVVWPHLDFGRRYGPNEEFGIRINGSYRKGDTELDRNAIEVGVGTLGLDYRGERARATLDVIYSNQDLTAPVSLFNEAAPGFDIPDAPNGRTNTANSFEFNNSEHVGVATRFEYDIFDNTTIYAAGGIGDYKEDFLSSSYRIENARGDATNFFAIQPQRIEGKTGEVGARSTFETFGIGHEVTIQATQALNELYRGGFPRRSFPSYRTNIYNPVPFAGTIDLRNYPFASERPLFGDLLSSSLAISDTLSVFDDRLQLTFGGRYQNIRSRSLDPTPGPTQGDVTFFDDQNKITPAFAALFQVTEAFSVYGNYIEALTEGPVASFRAVNAGQIFPPSVNEQIEVGAKYDLGTFAVTASLFEIEQPSPFTDPVTNVFSVSGRQVNRGIELTAFGEVFDSLRLLGGVTFLNAELDKTAGGLFDGNDVPGIADTQANIYAEYDMDWLLDGFSVNARAIYTGSVFYDQANLQKVDDWTRIDAGLEYAFVGPFEKEVVVRGNVENVFDENYYASAARGFLATGAPRTYTVSTAIEF
ncbi:TonB-dependent siderophore receptor [Fulvimarina endophytica]|uniref:TonB-dependent siderophore receptor n=1 Tax=Fulvimarina endophytica TaxID=2293836 RepID=A0A371X2T8_9HYPH|nr:TonB-dependent siderophore receptor [Fulvimarina endophytica]RFC63526.1 TonB-dependent siderophore receptor [Fulvimarina endophytica]